LVLGHGTARWFEPRSALTDVRRLARLARWDAIEDARESVIGHDAADVPATKEWEIDLIVLCHRVRERPAESARTFR
jgi:hypothetical protein